MQYVAQAADGRTVSYVDRKRYLWMVVWLSPLMPVITMGAYFALGNNPWVLLAPLVYWFLVAPAMDAISGEDNHNPPDEVLPKLCSDNYYRFVLFSDVALVYIVFFLMAWFVGTQNLPWWAFIAFALGAGMTSADMVFASHEMGHKKRKLDRVMAQIATAIIGYGQFNTDHNRGHHVQVATPEDSASARMGESVYRFALREMPGTITRGWPLEAKRLAALGHKAWSIHNEILQSWALSVVIAATVIALWGWIMVPFLLIHHLYAWYGATQANYVEHYGLMRAKLPNGRYELPQPWHSWNTNHIYSNLITLNVQRHSDHHVNAMRPYQGLRNYDHLPRLPSGYPGCFGLAMIPPLWYKVMDAKLLEWCGGDLSKLNIDPKHRDAIYAKYGVRPTVDSQADFADTPVLDLAESEEFPSLDEIERSAAATTAAAERHRPGLSG